MVNIIDKNDATDLGKGIKATTLKIFTRLTLFLLFFLLIPASLFAQWVQTSGPYGGNIYSFTMSGTNLLAGTLSNGVFVSTNNGSSWTSTGLNTYNVRSFVVAGSNVFAGTSGGVFISTDNGLSWNGVNTGLANSNVQALIMSGTILFAGTNGGGVFLSAHNGATWSAANTGISTVNVQALVMSGTNLFAGTNGNGVYLSTNNGTSWTAVNTGLGSSNIQALLVSGTNLFAGTDAGVYLSTNNGTSWTLVNNGLTSTNVIGLVMNGSNLFAGTSAGNIFLSTNNGATWTLKGTIYNILTLFFNGTNFFAGTNGGGAYISTDNGANWNAINKGLTANNIFALTTSSSNILAGTGNGIFLSTDNGTSWNTSLANSYVRSFATNGTMIAAGSPGNGVYVSTDNGTSWTLSTTGLTNNNIYAVAFCGTKLFASAYGTGIFVSTDNGTSWSSIGSGLTNTNVFTFAVNGTNLFAGTIGGGVFLSTDNGANWSAMNTPRLTNLNVRTLVFNGSNLFAGTDGGGIFLSTNNGTSWAWVKTGLAADTSVYVMKTSGTNLFAATNEGVFLSTNNGTNWSAVNTNLTSTNIHSLEINNGFLFSGPFGGVVWRRPLSEMVPGPPTITSFSPTSGPIGTTVTITGTNFNTITANNIVYFGAVKAVVTTASTTSLNVTLPTGVTYQPISVTVNGLTAYTSAPFVVTFTGGGAISNSSFFTKLDFTTGTVPYSVAIGDVDGDGKPDIITANYGNSTISVFRNTCTIANVSFAAKLDFTTGTNPYSVAIGDVDGDGKPDLVVANFNSSTVSVFRNTSTIGSVSFAAKVDFPTGPGAYSVAIGDVDGDGKPDLIVANYSSSTVSIFRNTSTIGSVSFAAKVDFPTMLYPYNVAIGDVDGDGKPDLVVANSGSSTVSVLRNTGTIGSVSFADRMDFTTGSTPYSVAIGDVDGDGRPDLTVANYYSNTVSILRNTSTIGSVSFATKVDFTTGTNPQSIAIGDVDGDGKPDLAVANALSNTVSVLRNTSTIGSVSFAAKVDFTTGSSACSVAIGDVDGDGKPDLVVANYSSNTVSVFRNTINSGNTPPATPQNLTAAAGNGQVTLKWRKNTESDFLKYCIYMGTDSVNVLLKDSTSASISDTTKTITGLTNGTMYYFRVSALDSARLESGKSIAVGTMPQAPSTDLVLTPFSVSGKYINEQIAADTLANGWVTNRAYVLQRGGVYLCNTSINVPPGRKLNIRSDYNSSQHYDPIIYLYPPSGSARPPSYFVQLAGGTINLKRVLLSGYYEPNIVGLDSIQGGFLDVIAGTTTSNIYIDSCILKTTDGSHIRTDGKPVTIRVTNTIFADMGNIATGLSNFGAGRAIDLRDQDVDTCDIQNCTFVNAQDRIVRHYQSTAPIHNFIFNHNTVVNLMSYHGFLSLGMVDATGSGILQIKNNLLIDHFALGADTAYVRQQEFSDPQENDPLNGLPRMAWVLTNPNNTARWDISNNYFAISDSGNAMRTLSAAKGYIPRGHSGTDPQLTWKMNSVFASQGKDTTATFRQVTIAPASIPLLMTKMIRWIYTPRSAGGAGKEKPSSDPNYTKVSPGIWTYDYNRELLTWYYDVLDCSYRANQLLPSSDGKVAGDTRWRFNGIIGGITTPAAPQNLIATAGDAQVLLKWKKNTETDFLKYRVYIGTDSVSVLLKDSTSSSISDTTRTITGLTNGTTYYFRVSALDSTRLESSKSIAVSATPSSAIKILGEYTSDANTVLLLHMDETSGSTVSDASNYGNNGTATGTTIVNGRFGKTRSFNGTNDFITTKPGVIPSSGDFTVECWVQGNSASGYREIIAQGMSGNNFYIGYDTSKIIRLGDNWLSTGIQFPFGGWHHLALVKTGTNAFLYIDGVLRISKGSTIYNPKQVDTLVVGRQFGTAGEYWLGYIDEVRISNITRDPSTFNLQLPPKNLTVTPSGTSINLNWQNGGGAIPLMRYKIYRGADSTNVSIVDSTASLSFQQSGLGTGLYYYRISAVDSTGFEGAKSYAAGATAVSAPVISLSATTIVFGSVSSGSTTTKSLVVTNTGTATLTGTVSVTANAGFSINKTSISIAAGGKDSVIITFSPTATQSYSATLTITHNAAGSPSTVTLSGTGIGGPSISVSPSSVLVVSNGTFASATVGTVVVTNNGTATLSGTVSYSGSSKLSASPSTLNIAALNSSTITIFISSVSIADGTYSGTITITHNASGSPTAIPIVVRKVSILSTFTASKQFTFESTGSGTNYKLIGIPGITSYSASSIFSGTYKQDWRMYRDNGSTSSNYLVEYDGSSYFSFGLGKGFWVLAKQSKTFSATLSNYISSGAFPISLYSGWNIITNPFELTVLWSDVITYNQSQLGSNAANSIIYSWDNGVWSQATSLVPYSAYYFYNNGNLNTLSIPYDANGALAKQNALAKTSETISPPVSNQHLKISISTGDVETSSVYMAFDEHASNNYDNKDYFAPPASFAVANIQIENIDLSTEQKRLWIEHRTSVGEGQRFHLVVKNTASISSLVVEGLDNFPNDQVYLLDEQRKELYDLKLCQHFDVPTNSEEYRYSVLIGRNKFIDTLNAVIVPNTYSIAQNYPNPFNPTTTIEYTLPQQSHVKMVVYDIMGREVAILVDEFKNAGRYSVIWNATRCASGVYFCRLTMGDYRSIKKLLLLK